MIEGLKIRVPSKELADHLNKRADHHLEKAAKLSAEIEGLIAVSERIKTKSASDEDIAKVSKVANYNANVSLDDLINQFETDIRGRRNKALAFAYLASHLFDEDYTLQENDLIRVELLSGRW